jgi:hypothetical protein
MPIIGVTGSQNTKSFLQPNPPTIVSATDVGTGRAYNNGAVSIAFTPAATGAPATSFTVTSSPGGYTETGASSPLTVTGLQSDTAYTFTVTGTNAAGTGQPSSASSSITATTVPQAPTIGAATATGGATATVAFTAGATGGKAVSTFTATSSPSSITGTNASSPITVPGLTQNTAYTFTVTATNANGTSLASSASGSITTFKLTLVDTFNRANGALGTSSDGLSSWSVIRGNFTVDGNKAYSTDTSDSLATATLSTSAVSNAQIDMVSDQGGVGLAVWAADSANYWGVYPHYTTTTNSTTNFSTTCTGPGFAGTGPTTCQSSSNVTGSFGPYSVALICQGTSVGATVRPECSLNATQQNYGASSCEGDYYASCTPTQGGGYNFATNTNASNVTNSITNYSTSFTSALRIKSANAVVVNNQYASSISPLRSIAVSTSGNVITYTGYSAANKGGSTLVTSTYDAGAGTKAGKFGVFKTSSSYLQGSYVDNISVTVV